MEVRKTGRERDRPSYRVCSKCTYYKNYLKAKRKKKPGGRFFKWLVSLVVLHGMVCVSMSYILAWMEHSQVVEGVSSTIITEIVASIVVYGATKTIENIFEKNRLKFSEPINKVAPVQLAEEMEEEL